MLGVQVTRPWDGEAGPIWSCETPTGGAIYVRFLRQRAWFGTSAVYAERLAIPGHPECHHVGGMRPDAPPTVDKAARDGLRRLLELDLRTGSGGRPSEPQARARGRLLKAGRRALKRLDIAPQQLTRPMVAQELNRSAAPGKNPRADDVWTRAKWRLPDLKRALDDEETRV
jgi:hypothetical protein